MDHSGSFYPLVVGLYKMYVMVVNKCEKNSTFNDKYFLRLLRVLTIMIITINNTGREGLTTRQNILIQNIFHLNQDENKNIDEW